MTRSSDLVSPRATIVSDTSSDLKTWSRLSIDLAEKLERLFSSSSDLVET